MSRMNAPKTVTDQLRDAVRLAIKNGRTLNEIAVTADISHSVAWNFMNNPSKTLTLETAHSLAKSLGIVIKIG